MSLTAGLPTRAPRRTPWDEGLSAAMTAANGVVHEKANGGLLVSGLQWALREPCKADRSTAGCNDLPLELVPRLGTPAYSLVSDHTGAMKPGIGPW